MIYIQTRTDPIKNSIHSERFSPLLKEHGMAWNEVRVSFIFCKIVLSFLFITPFSFLHTLNNHVSKHPLAVVVVVERILDDFYETMWKSLSLYSWLKTVQISTVGLIREKRENMIQQPIAAV